MSLITVPQAQDGVTGVNAASVNNPVNTIANDYNGNITDANIASAAAIAFSKIAGGSATALTAFQSWNPSFTNFTPGSATILAKYTQIGKFVAFHLRVTLSSSTMGSVPKFTLPVTASSNYLVSGGFEKAGIMAHFEDSGNATYIGFGYIDTTTTCTLQVYNAAATYLQNSAITAGVPFAWGDADYFSVIGSYEAA